VILQHSISDSFAAARQSPKRFHGVPQTAEAAAIFLHGLLIALQVQKQCLQCLDKVEHLLLGVVETDANSLNLADQLVKRLVTLSCLPIVGPLQLVLDFLRALIVYGGIPLLQGLL
jgi:hypothetical protein